MNTKAQALLNELDERRSRQSQKQVVGMIVALIILGGFCFGFTWLERQRVTQTSAQPPIKSESSISSPRLLALTSQATTNTSFIVVKSGAAGRDDLWLHTAMTSTTVISSNLTRTPSITEVWPILSSDGHKIAYYAVSKASIDLYLLTLPDGNAFPLTEAADESGLHTKYAILPNRPPVFSPDNEWVAFLAQNVDDDTVDPFVARTNGKQVIYIDSLGLNIQAYDWLEDNKLLVTTLSPNGKTELWTAIITATEKIELERFN